jgi:hypothetical protein
LSFSQALDVPQGNIAGISSPPRTETYLLCNRLSRSPRVGYRDRTFETRLGSLSLRIPKLRQGSYFPPFRGARPNDKVPH